jgi:hypothetical protein
MSLLKGARPPTQQEQPHSARHSMRSPADSTHTEGQWVSSLGRRQGHSCRPPRRPANRMRASDPSQRTGLKPASRQPNPRTVLTWNRARRTMFRPSYCIERYWSRGACNTVQRRTSLVAANASRWLVARRSLGCMSALVGCGGVVLPVRALVARQTARLERAAWPAFSARPACSPHASPGRGQPLGSPARGHSASAEDTWH